MSRRWIVIDPGFEHQDSHHMVVNNQIVSACSDDNVVIVSGKNLEHTEKPHFLRCFTFLLNSV